MDETTVNSVENDAERLLSEKQDKRAVRAQRKEAARQRRTTAYGLHLNGHSFRRIAEQLGVSVRTAYVDFQRERDALADLEREPMLKRRDTAIQRLETLLTGLMAKATAGDARSAEVAIKLIERQAKLLGLDSPLLVAMKADITTHGDRYEDQRHALRQLPLDDLERLHVTVTAQMKSPNWNSPAFAGLPGLGLIQGELRRRADDERQRLQQADPLFVAHCAGLDTAELLRLKAMPEAERTAYRDRVVAQRALPAADADVVVDADVVTDDPTA
jgi:hypothetical protein